MPVFLQAIGSGGSVKNGVVCRNVGRGKFVVATATATSRRVILRRKWYEMCSDVDHVWNERFSARPGMSAWRYIPALRTGKNKTLSAARVFSRSIHGGRLSRREARRCAGLGNVELLKYYAHFLGTIPPRALLAAQQGRGPD